MWTKPGAIAASAALILAGCQGGAPHTVQPSPSQAPESRMLTIGVDLPLHGGSEVATQPVVNAIEMAIDEANATGGVGGWTLVARILDDAPNGPVGPTGFPADPQQGAANVQVLVGDPSVIGLIGPFNSNVASAEIPITNQAGLLQCSPSTTAPFLTIPPAGLEYRLAFPNRISFVRVAATDDKQGPAAAQYAIQVLRTRRAFIIDDAESFGQGVATAFAEAFRADGGTVVGRASLPNTVSDFASVLSAAKVQRPDVLYFGTDFGSRAGPLRKQMAQAGMGGVRFMGPDGLPVNTSFIDAAGPAAADSYASVDEISDYPGKADFTSRYRARFNADPGPYTAAGYACTQVILDALKNSTGPDLPTLREQVRAYAVDSQHMLATILGDISFDANGDTTQQLIAIYRVDLAAAGGTGAWVFDQQVNFTKK